LTYGEFCGIIEWKFKQKENFLKKCTKFGKIIVQKSTSSRRFARFFLPLRTNARKTSCKKRPSVI